MRKDVLGFFEEIVALLEDLPKAKIEVPTKKMVSPSSEEKEVKDLCDKAYKKSETYPKANVYDLENSYELSLAVPGVKREDLDIVFTPPYHTEMVSSSATVQVKGKMSEEYKSPENASFQVRELKQTSFARTFVLPTYLNYKENPKVSLKDGILSMVWKVEKKTAAIPTATKLQIE